MPALVPKSTNRILDGALDRACRAAATYRAEMAKVCPPACEPADMFLACMAHMRTAINRMRELCTEDRRSSVRLIRRAVLDVCHEATKYFRWLLKLVFDVLRDAAIAVRLDVSASDRAQLVESMAQLVWAEIKLHRQQGTP